MTLDNPHPPQEMLPAIRKNREQRWGLSVVSFLADETCRRLDALRTALQNAWAASSDCIAFAGPGQIHTTHLTLTRSQPEGPVRREQLIRPGADLFGLCEAIRAVTGPAAPFCGRFTTLQMGADGISLVLKGESSHPETVLHRGNLQALEQHLWGSFQVERKWEKRPQEFFCVLGYLKEAISAADYERLTHAIGEQTFAAVDFELAWVTLVHHQNRTLAPPLVGSVTFPLGMPMTMGAGEFAARLNLAGEPSQSGG